MYLYNSYCYPDINSAAVSFFSQGTVSGFGILQSFTIISADTVQYSFIFNPVVTTVNGNGNGGGGGNTLITYSTASFDYTFQSCLRTGFDNSFFGFELVDIYLITSAMVAILITAGCARLVINLVRHS